MKTFLEYCHQKQVFTSITLHEICDDNEELFCFACRDLVIGGPTYILERDHDDRDYLHKSCAELPGKIQHPLHPQHPLTVRDYCDGFICDGCRHVSFGYQYRCKTCKFKLDFQCVSKNEGQALKERVEEHTIYHPHKLQLVHFRWPIPTQLSEDIRCCCCLKSCPDGRDPTYSCNVCIESGIPLFIRKSCLDTVPRQVQSSFHPEHPLFIRRLHADECLDNYCGVCDFEIRGFALACDQCFLLFHVSCGSRATRGLRLNLHRHDMHYVISDSPKRCTICEAYRGGAFYRCVKCDVNVHMECIRIPEIVEHESHEYHPLKLTDSVVTQRDDDEYRCDICEEEGNIKHRSYYCNECNFIAHVQCVLSHENSTSETKDAEVETDDADVENDDAEEETDDAEEKTKDEVHDSQDDWDTSSYSSNNSEHSSDGRQYDKSNVDYGIVNIQRRIEELALQLEAIANSDKRIENVKAGVVGLVFQLEDLRKKLIKSRDY